MNHTNIFLNLVTQIKPFQLLKTTQISIHKIKIKENPETTNTRDHKLEKPSNNHHSQKAKDNFETGY